MQSITDDRIFSTRQLVILIIGASLLVGTLGYWGIIGYIQTSYDKTVAANTLNHVNNSVDKILEQQAIEPQILVNAAILPSGQIVPLSVPFTVNLSVVNQTK